MQRSTLMSCVGPVLGLLLLVLGFATAHAAVGLGDVVNATCPISGQPVDGSRAVEHAGKKIGVCCGKCEAAVAAWTTEQKDAYLTKMAQAGKGQEKAAAPADDAVAFEEPYLLTVCPISGQPTGDQPVAVTLEGRTIQVCCEKCKAKAEADPKAVLAKVDQMIADQQRPYYPLTHCVVMPDESLVGEDGADAAKEVVVGNRLFRACCPGCIKKIKADPAKFAAILDEAAKKAQAATYPLDHCIVNPSAKFTDAKPANEFVIAGRLVRTCCGSCEKKVRKDPAKYLAALDAAVAAKK